MFEINTERPISWTSPEAQALIKKHLMEQLNSGIFEPYIITAVESGRISRGGIVSVDEDTVQVAKSELPLIVYVDKARKVDYPSTFGTYFLCKIDPRTGKEVRNDEGTTLVYVAEIEEDGEIVRVGSRFTEDQARLVFAQAQELEELGLVPQLSR